MITTLIIFLLQVTLAVGIIVGFNFVKTEVIQQNRKNIAFAIFSVAVFNLLISLIFLYKDREIECAIYFLFSLPWFIWFEKQTITVHNTFVFNLYRKFTGELVEINHNKIELIPGEHYVPWPWFIIGIAGGHGEEPVSLEGFDSKNNTLEIPDFNALTQEPLVVSVEEIEVQLDLNQDYSYQFDFFSYKGMSGQNAVALFIQSQVKDALKHFVGKHGIKQLDNSEKVRLLFEENGHHRLIIAKVNTQIREFKVNVRGKQEELAAYSVKVIKIGEIKPSVVYLTEQEKKLVISIENDRRDTVAQATKRRAQKYGYTIEQLLILEEKIKGINIGGSGKHIPLVST